MGTVMEGLTLAAWAGSGWAGLGWRTSARPGAECPGGRLGVNVVLHLWVLVC